MTEASNTTNATTSLVSDFNIKKILDLLPHRYPMLLVDRVVEFESGKRIKAIKNVTFNEPFFNGHFPGHPVMPGVLILEALAQTAALLTFGEPGHQRNENDLYLFTAIDGARFKRQVVPGDQLCLHAELLRGKRGFWKFKVFGMVDNEIAAEAEIMCAIIKDEPKGAA
ncbi:3-hydroxyacyl-ACP dehydratase FabZ [Ralstonia insidiosa]|jgi:3-hydroxyacyl-[acyl-carrier-protein] dehydratase|uniref:3-hydroxyacyl-[acyl-carrier-protein] dehydratase FabZ n=1 Tax=Ralstonia insidiosa TaxID=190721 RepID=A0A191ZWI7_9RALS|nr:MULTISPECIES: 3-hydroxyacyl-ACP dehydratase FabZ [Ralstonia]ANH73964.1 beta-hydroxyacyl-(acyl-carrier-protein) dehydratase FabZ [Ralstonia insidiosa]ANJ72530.1 3-hydroxyacyl-[acyl-carrier-protein] dehydratase FabZ [Ralstonia insidiosa]EPX98109.1 3-hydroxyacyl-ACP dehydratase [Ralstonia sp. AU12-08]KAB0473079.1 3-hydroxyacyl-ACP dehydratase FabZ [Ralstonia insidiosa]MBY4704360.1 3-hydroxyacyl-ACP dehydratase FabZ [Ralstonia insidiosa]